MSEDSTWQWVSMKPGTMMSAADVDLARAPVFAAYADDAVAADRDVALDEIARDEIEHPPALQHEIGLIEAAPLRDGAGEKGGVGHAGLRDGGLSLEHSLIGCTRGAPLMEEDWGGAEKRRAFRMWLTPFLTLPHKGGGDSLRRGAAGDRRLPHHHETATLEMFDEPLGDDRGHDFR